MKRYSLHVPQADNQAARAAGARWDNYTGEWYAMTESDEQLRPLARWLDKETRRALLLPFLQRAVKVIT